MDTLEIGKFVRARVPWRGTTAWITGKVKEIKRDGGGVVIESGWNINLDIDDELIWCGDAPCPEGIR